MKTETNVLNDRLEQLEQKTLQLHTENAQFRAQFQTAQRRLRITTGLAFATLIGAILVSPGSRAAMAQSYGVTLQQLATRLSAAETTITSLQTRSTALENKTQFMAADTAGKWTIFNACNVYVRNGLGATNGNPNSPFDPKTAITNGLGNLIIGYNAGGNYHGDQRGGSHNLILGDENNYTSYGGAVMGFNNIISNDYATITGGAQSLASGELSSISGGLSNAATAAESSISGGAQNTASGLYSSINGGLNNIASGSLATISGGNGLTQSNAGGWSAGSLHMP